MADIALQHAVQAVLDDSSGRRGRPSGAVVKDGALVAEARSGVADPVSGEPVSAGTFQPPATRQPGGEARDDDTPHRARHPL